MAKKSLPDDETVLKQLLTVARDCLDFLEPVVRQLELEWRVIATGVSERRLDVSFFEKVHEALTDRLARGGPPHTALLPYLDGGRLEKPREQVGRARARAAQRLHSGRGDERDRSLHLRLCVLDFCENVAGMKAAVQAVRALQDETIDKLAGLGRQPTAPEREAPASTSGSGARPHPLRRGAEAPLGPDTKPAPSAAAASSTWQSKGQVPDAGSTPTDGTISEGRIWLDGHAYRLTEQLRTFLGFILRHPDAPLERARTHMGWTDNPHVHKRINDLNNKLADELAKAPRRLRVWVDDSCVCWEWR
jgi:hypothetical protein